MRPAVESSDDLDSWDGLDPLDVLYGWRGVPEPRPERSGSKDARSSRLRPLAAVIILAVAAPVLVVLLSRLGA